MGWLQGVPPERRTPWFWAIPVACALVILGVWVWAAIEPYDRTDWFLENILVFLSVPTFAYFWLRRPFTHVATALTTIFLVLHIIGSHTSYALVPFGDKLYALRGVLFSADGRNPYDRLVHFLYGFLLSLPLAEFLQRRGVKRGTSLLLVFQFMLATSALYEIIEWATAEIVDPTAGSAFLGSQGDEFDAVKDMALAGAGSLIICAAAGLANLFRTPRPTAQAEFGEIAPRGSSQGSPRGKGTSGHGKAGSHGKHTAPKTKPDVAKVLPPDPIHNPSPDLPLGQRGAQGWNNHPKDARQR